MSVDPRPGGFGVYVVDAETGEPARCVTQHDEGWEHFSEPAPSPDGRTLAFLSNGTIVLLDLRTGTYSGILTDPPLTAYPFVNLSILPTGDGSCSSLGTTSTWRISPGCEICRVLIHDCPPEPPEAQGTLVSLSSSVTPCPLTAPASPRAQRDSAREGLVDNAEDSLPVPGEPFLEGEVVGGVVGPEDGPGN